MYVKTLEKNDSLKWDEFVIGEPYSIAWQMFEWSHLLDKHYEVQFYPLAAIQEDKIVGILPLYRIKAGKEQFKMISVPYAVAGGMLAGDPDVRKALLETAQKISLENGCKEITLKQYKLKIEGDLAADDNFYNRELNIEGGPNEVWKRISQKNRELVDSTEGNAFQLEHPFGDLMGFYRFLLKHHRRKGVPCVSRKWITDLVDLGLYSVAVLRQDGRIVAGTMVKEFKDTVSFPFSCSLGESPGDALPVYRLYWELIAKFSENNFRIYHSGRIPNTEDVDPYRLGWGGEKNPYYYQYFPPTVRKTEYASKRSWKRDVFSAVWKRMPLFVVGWLGPKIVQQFP